MIRKLCLEFKRRGEEEARASLCLGRHDCRSENDRVASTTYLCNTRQISAERSESGPGLMTRVIQISDTHLSPTKRHFADNWAPMATWVVEQKPDLVIHTGDITVDAADEEADAAHCATLLKALGVPV